MTNEKYSDNTPMDLPTFVLWCRQSPQRHIQLIAEYADERKMDLKTKAQWELFIRRNVRAAKDLSIFTDEQIEEAIIKINEAEKKYLSKWSMESILKYLLK